MKWHKAVQVCLPPAQSHHREHWGSHLIQILWQFTRKLWQHRNSIVHGSGADESANRILMGLRDQVTQHYLSFQADNNYVLSRHRHLFTTRTLAQRLTVSYDYLVCWLRSVEEARSALSFHIHSQSNAATRFFGQRLPPQGSESDESDEDYSVSNASDISATTFTRSTRTMSASEDSSLPSASSYAPEIDASLAEDAPSDSSSHLDFSTQSCVAPLEPSIGSPIVFHSNCPELDLRYDSDEDVLLRPLS